MKTYTIESIVAYVFSEWWLAFIFTILFFAVLYFGGVLIFSGILSLLKKRFNVVPIVSFKKKERQKTIEIKNSILSIFIFALQAIPLQWLYAERIFVFGQQSLWHLAWQIPILFLWNEIYFYASHWLLHRKWFFMNVHKTHHASREPTLYSVYSFHWFEAFILGAVIFIPILVYPFQVIAILSLPIMSIVLNFLGHWNHEKPTERPPNYLSRFTFRHTMHHKWSMGNFGFMLPYLDMLFKTNVPDNKT